MIKQIWLNLRATAVFIIVRLSASFLVGLVYLLASSAVQYQFVVWFGESSFNYIVGGLLSLLLCTILCTYLGRLVFIFIRGWHMAALAYAKPIVDKGLSALDVGQRVFRKHFTSFAAVYGLKLVSDKFIVKGAEQIWELLKNLPYIGALRRFSKNPLVNKVAKDLLDNCFDGVMYYLVKYTKPGLKDDVKALPDAVRRYLYSLPQLLLTSFSTYILLHLLPRVLKVVAIVGVFFTQGIVGGVLINVLMYPLFYLLENTVLNPLETIFLMSTYSNQCKEETKDVSKYESFVQQILDYIFPNDEEKQEETSDEEDETPKKKPAEPKKQAASVEDDEDEAPTPRQKSFAFDDDEADEDLATVRNRSHMGSDPFAARRKEVLNNLWGSAGMGSTPGTGGSDGMDDEAPPAKKLTDLLSKLNDETTRDIFNKSWEDSEFNPPIRSPRRNNLDGEDNIGVL